MSATDAPATPVALDLGGFGTLTPISRTGGQGRVHRPATAPAALHGEAIVVKLYRRPPPPEAAAVLAEMVRWERALGPEHRAWLARTTGWPVAVITARDQVVGIAMRDLTPRFEAPFLMPSGRRENVLLALEHLLGRDSFLEARGLNVQLGTATRALVAERISGALGVLHQHAIVASDIAPSNVLVAFQEADVGVCLIDCDSMVFQGRQALATVETGDWDLPAAFGEAPSTRSADAYKLGLVVLRLFARSHDARSIAPHLLHVPVELRDLLHRALAADAPNRPPAGEWQRALYALVVAGGLDHRYPGPAVPPAPAALPGPAGAPRPNTAAPVRALRPRAQTVAPVRALRPQTAAPLRALRPRPQSAALGLPGVPRPPAPSATLKRAVLALWVVAFAAVLVLLATRLLAAGPPVRTTTTYFAPGPGGRVVPSVVTIR